MLELDVIQDRAGNGLDIGARWPKVFLDMANRQAVEQIGQAVDYQDPSEHEVPVPRIRQVLETGNGDPLGPAAILKFTIGLRPAQYAGGVEMPGVDLGDSNRAGLRLHCDQREEGEI